ncbi:MAG: DUF5009 domain-containing protein [Bryobacteraceae bacterium]|nr:DUF5009 domain-containing protein [Bryobacteraceae bacterium]
MHSGQRLTSLDAFRGATIALMVLVNTPGTGSAVYGPLRHAEWDGWTITDVVFPSFVWIVGVAITLALGRRLQQGVAKSALLRQAVKRAAILFTLGLLVYAFPKFDVSTFRILGVLQRIAICYLAASVIYLYCSLRAQLAVTAALLGVYWAAMKLIPVPGHGAGFLDVERNLAHYVDRIILGSHNYEHTRTWDPEGILSTLPAIATAMLGVMAGHILASRADLRNKVRLILSIGAGLLAAGWICDFWLPINKKLWTSSFTLFMAGLDFLLFGAFVWVADIAGQKRIFQPFVIFGMNAIAVYMASELVDITLHSTPMGARSARVWLYETFFAPLASPHNASLLYAVCYTLVMFAIAWVMYRRKWFVRV